MDVRWNLPESDLQETIHWGRVSIEPDELLIGPSITWKDVDVLDEPGSFFGRWLTRGWSRAFASRVCQCLIVKSICVARSSWTNRDYDGLC
jgi:hypothetical protein